MSHCWQEQRRFIENVLFPIEENKPDATCSNICHGALNKALFSAFAS